MIRHVLSNQRVLRTGSEGALAQRDGANGACVAGPFSEIELAFRLDVRPVLLHACRSPRWDAKAIGLCKRLR